jgi:arylformamidase
VTGSVLHDLSHPLRSGMPVYPGDPEVSIGPALTVAGEGVNVLGLHLGSQSGTHVDAPYHVNAALPDLDALPLERFMGPAVLLDARGTVPRQELPASALDPVADRLGPGTVLLVVTGWSRHWGSPAYLGHPFLSPELSRRILDLGVLTVGIDALSVDVTPADEAPPADAAPPAGDATPDDDPPPATAAAGLPSHQVLCGAHAVIAENLTALEPLLAAQDSGRAIEVSLLPLRIEHGDGAPVRAVATVRG